MESIVSIKRTLHQLEMVNRTSAWGYLVRLFDSDPDRADLATLCLHQMFINLDEMEGPPQWSAPERENEYDDYYNLAQRILSGYSTKYVDSTQFQWELCYYLMCYPTYHWLCGTIHVVHFGDEKKLRDTLIQQFLLKHPDSMLFKYIDPIQERERNILEIIQPEDLSKLRNEIIEWNLQDNFADQEVHDFFVRIL